MSSESTECVTKNVDGSKFGSCKHKFNLESTILTLIELSLSGCASVRNECVSQQHVGNVCTRTFTGSPIMASRERPHNSWSRILQPRPVAGESDRTGGYPVRPEDYFGALGFMQTFERNPRGVGAAAGGDLQGDIAGVATKMVEQWEELRSIHRAESDRRPGGVRLNRNRDR